MKSDKYFVLINSSVESFCRKIRNPHLISQGTFTSVSDNLYSLKLEKPLGLKFLEELDISQPDSKLKATVLFPITEKYNKRRTKRAISIVEPSINRDINRLVESLFEIEPALCFKDYLNFFKMEEHEILPVLEELQLQGKLKIIEYTTLFAISLPFFNSLIDQIRARLKEGLKSSRRYITVEDIFKNLSYPISGILSVYILQQLQEDIPHSITGGKIQFLKPSLNSKDKKLTTQILKAMESFTRPVVDFDTLSSKTGLPFNEMNNALWYLINEGELTQLNEQDIVLTDFLNKLINKLKKYKRNYGDNIDITTFREQTSLNREQIISVFEYFDSQGITSRIGNIRRILLTV